MPVTDQAKFGIGEALTRKGQGLLAADTLEQEEAADHFLGLGKGAVDQLLATLAQRQPRGPLGRSQRVAGHQHAALLQHLGETQHPLVHLLAGLAAAFLALADRLDDQEHVRHGGLLLLRAADCGASLPKIHASLLVRKPPALAGARRPTYR